MLQPSLGIPVVCIGIPLVVPGHPTCPGRPIAPVHSNSLAQPTFGKALAIWSPTSANDLPLQRQKKLQKKTNELNVNHVHHPNIGSLLKTPPTYCSSQKKTLSRSFSRHFSVWGPVSELEIQHFAWTKSPYHLPQHLICSTQKKINRPCPRPQGLDCFEMRPWSFHFCWNLFHLFIIFLSSLTAATVVHLFRKNSCQLHFMPDIGDSSFSQPCSVCST